MDILLIIAGGVLITAIISMMVDLARGRIYDDEWESPIDVMYDDTRHHAQNAPD